MRRWKKIALALLAILLVSQAPFAYRRYKLGRLHATIESLNAARSAGVGTDGDYVDHAGVVHVHSFLGGHSAGRFEEIVEAARANGLSFVVMTEHTSAHVDTAAATLNGTHGGVLFVGGNELNPAREDRLLVMPGLPPPDLASASPADAAATNPSSLTRDAAERARREGKLVLVAYPEQFQSWDETAGAFDGVEIYNLFTNAKKINYPVLFFDGVWSYRSYPHLLFATFYEKPAAELKIWDELMLRHNRRLVAVAGNDAHSNVGLSFQDLTGETFAGVKLDPYERSFRVVRTHVLLEKEKPLDRHSLASALAGGHTYVAFDLFCDARGFLFTADSGAETKIMGDEITLAEGGEVRLRVRTPVKSRVVFLRDGRLLHEEKDTLSKELTVRERGVYRVEVYLDQLGVSLGGKPWIISNPIYVR